MAMIWSFLTAGRQCEPRKTPQPLTSANRFQPPARQKNNIGLRSDRGLRRQWLVSAIAANGILSPASAMILSAAVLTPATIGAPPPY